MDDLIKTDQMTIPWAKVLIVDNTKTNLSIARAKLKPYGTEVFCVTGGREAIDLIRSETNRFNIIFMDLMMPEIDGMETVRIIREEIGTEYAKTVPIIALTANETNEIRENFLSKGFQAYIGKPIDNDQLDAVLREWVKLS